MWVQFFSQNFHFAVNIFAGLASLGVSWLYFDAWSNKRSLKEAIKWVGFAALSASFLLGATVIEQAILGSSLLGDFTLAAATFLRLTAYILIAFGLLLEPLQKVPQNMGIQLDEQNKLQPTQIEQKTSLGILASIGSVGSWMAPFGSGLVAYMYLRHATVGLERHLRPMFRAFAFIAVSDVANLATNFRGSNNPILSSWFAAFGWIWWIEYIALSVGVYWLARWVWGYLTERFFSQLFMTFTVMVMMIFLIVSFSFTSLLINNVQRDSLTRLETAANVMSYAIEAKQSETLSVAEQLSSNSSFSEALVVKDRNKMISIAESILVDKQLSSLIITNQSGQVILRAEDTDRWGDSISSDPLVKRSLFGASVSTVTIKNEPGVPILRLLSSVAIFDKSNIMIGTVQAGIDLNNAFVDRIKQSTDLQSSVYAGDSLAATTLLAPDGKTHALGVKINKQVRAVVFDRKQTYRGGATLQNRQMLTAYVPVKDIDDQIVGAVMVAEPKSSILKIAGRSIELTFVMAACLIVLSFIPTYFMSRSIARQLD
jgi:Single cache domain 3